MQQPELEFKENVQFEAKDGKYLIFQLQERGYGIPILKVSEIIGLMEITPVPRTPYFIKGIVNLRGKIIPVLDLRLKFDMPERVYDEQTCIIIVNVSVEGEKKQMGVLVDIVSEVFKIQSSEIEPPPNWGSSDDEEFLEGVGKIKDKVVMLLNIDKVVYSEEIIRLLADKQECVINTVEGV